MKQQVSLMVMLAALLAAPAIANAAHESVPAAAAASGPDDDGDGVLNSLDECPATPAGKKVLPDGCLPHNDCRKPRAGEPADDKGCTIERVYILHGVKFEFDSDRLTPAAKPILADIATAMRAYPKLKFELHGHTCSMGSDRYNQRLSERRARSAMAFLVQQGISADRMTAVGFGESKPIDTNDTKAGREYNRRVELKVIE